MNYPNFKEMKGKSARETTAIMMQSIKNILRDAGAPDPEKAAAKKPAAPVLQTPPKMRAPMPKAKAATPRPDEAAAPRIDETPKAAGSTPGKPGLLGRFFGKG